MAAGKLLLYRKGRAKKSPRVTVVKKSATRTRRRTAATYRTVKKALRQMAEKKVTVFNFTDYPECLQQSGSAMGGNYTVCTPSPSTYGYNIDRGDANNQMEGNKIKISKLIHKFTINPTPYHATTNTSPRPVYVKFYYFKNKVHPAADQSVDYFANSTTAGIANFLDLGSGDYGFVGTNYDIVRDVEKQNYTLLKTKTFKIGNSNPPTAAGTGTTNHTYANNDFKMSAMARVSLTKFCKGDFIKNDNNEWTKPWIFCLVQVVAADGSLFTPSQLPVQIQSNIRCEFIDV